MPFISFIWSAWTVASEREPQYYDKMQGKLSDLRSELDMVACKPFIFVMYWNTLAMQYVNKLDSRHTKQKERNNDVLQGEGISLSSIIGSSGSDLDIGTTKYGNYSNTTYDPM